MRYLMLSLAASFLLACGDTDNPVVPTAPAGKATVDLSEEECQAATSLPASFLEQARQLNPDLDEDLLLSTWKAHGCADEVLWGLSWMVTKDAEVTLDVVIYTPPPEDDPETAAHTKTGDNIHTQSEIDSGHGRATRWTSSGSNEVDVINASIKNRERFDEFLIADLLPTVRISNSCRDGNTAVFTFERDGPTTEGLTFSYTYYSVGAKGAVPSTADYKTIITGFGVGSNSFKVRWPLSGEAAARVYVEIAPGWHSDMTGDFKLGTSSAEVDKDNTPTCN